MTDTLTTITTWDATTPGGYALFFIALIVASVWHVNLGSGL